MINKNRKHGENNFFRNRVAARNRHESLEPDPMERSGGRGGRRQGRDRGGGGAAEAGNGILNKTSTSPQGVVGKKKTRRLRKKNFEWDRNSGHDRMERFRSIRSLLTLIVGNMISVSRFSGL